MFHKVLIANRGEIALRVIRALREMEIPSVAVFADQDENALFTKCSDYAYPLDGTRARDTYMNIEKLIHIAKEVGADAIHPGYGFLSEKEDFAKAVEDAGITFIGPRSDVIARMGNKFEARKVAQALQIPLVPGTNDAVESVDEAKEIAARIGYPILIKPAAGGGGKGMKIVFHEDELDELFHNSQRLAKSVFGDSSVFVERYFPDAHHIEIQILADKFGNVVHLGERECSIQRRFQKVVEESPCLLLSNDLRQDLYNYSVSIAKEVGYHGAGTIEFIYAEGKAYFLEMNTRVQVEHAVTEMVTGIDIVKAMTIAAAGRPLPFTQEDITFRGHAIECRVYAEDPQRGFIPTHEEIIKYQTPEGIGIRIDSGVTLGSTPSHHFDPMLSKLIVTGTNRSEAIARMKRALDEYIIEGPKTNIDYLKAIMENKNYKENKINTKFIEHEHEHLMVIANQMPVWKNKRLKEFELMESLGKEIQTASLQY